MNVLKWSEDAPVGARLVYHRGNTSPSPSKGIPALRASDEGKVFLAQRKRADGGYDYEATRISLRTAKLLGLVAPDRIRYPSNLRNAA